jgi:D-aminopeptidase
MGGAPVGQELGRYAFQRYGEDGEANPNQPNSAPAPEGGDDGRGIPDMDGGSIMMVVATDAPISDRNLRRLASRAIMGLARTGSSGSNGSGDYVLAFSSAAEVRRTPSQGPRTLQDLPNDAMAGLFQATIESTEEAIYNSLLKATDVTGNGGRTAEAIPLEELKVVLRKYGVIGG